MPIKNNKNFIIFALMVTIVIDIMGVGLVFPIIPVLVMGSHSILLPGGASHIGQLIAYGVAMAVWPLGIFFGGPFLGDLSDKIGRRKTLVICLFFTALIYAFTAYSIIIHNFWLFILGRFCSGYVGGAFEIAQATVADISPKETKARNLSWIIFAASLGFIIGPLITSFTADNVHISWMGPDTPFWIAAVISFVNMISIAVLLRDTYQPKQDARIHFLHAVTACKFIFIDKRIRFLGLCLFLSQAGWGFYVLAVPLFLQQQFSFSTHLIGLFFGVMGIATLLSVVFVQPQMLKRLTLRSAYIIAAIFAGIILVQSLIFQVPLMQWIPMFFSAVFQLVAYGVMMALLSNSVRPDEQGRVMGGSGAIFGLAWCLNALLMIVLDTIHIALPIWVGCILMSLSGVLLLGYRGKIHP